MNLADHVSRAMLSRHSHVRMEGELSASLRSRPGNVSG